MTIEKISPTSSNIQGMLLLKAMTAAIPKGASVHETFKIDHVEGQNSTVEVQLLVNGVSVPFTESVGKAWASMCARNEENNEELILAKAVELVAKAKLDGITEAFSEAEASIRAALMDKLVGCDAATADEPREASASPAAQSKNLEQALFLKNTERRSVALDDNPEACSVWLSVGVQSFRIGDTRDSVAEADWTRSMLAKALANLVLQHQISSATPLAQSAVEDIGDNPKFLDISHLELTTFCLTALRVCGINSVADLTSYTEPQLRKLPGVGAATARQIRDTLDARGFALKDK